MAGVDLLRTSECVCYLFGVAPGDCPSTLGPIGFEDGLVYRISGRDLVAVVQDYADTRIDPDDAEQLGSHLRVHQRVLETVMDRCRVVLPVRFGTVFFGGSREEARAAVQVWLEAEGELLRRRMTTLTGSVEYSLQVFWQPRLAAQRLFEEDEQLGSLRRELEARSRGTQFLLRRKLEQTLSSQLEEQTQHYFDDVFSILTQHSRDLQPEPVKQGSEGGWEMVLRFSCLLPPASVSRLTSDLAAVSERHGLRYRLTGPWPPYSFV